jgi:hypothetical protein
MGHICKAAPEISRAINRPTEIRTFTTGLPELDRVPPGKAAALARFAGAAKAPAWLPDDRRAATLVAFIRRLKRRPATMSSTCSTPCRPRCSPMRASTPRRRGCAHCDLDAASLRLRDVGAVLLDDSIGDTEVRAAVFALVDRAALTEAVAQVNLLARPTDESYLSSCASRLARCAICRRCLLGSICGGASGQPLLDAVDHLRRVHR